MSETIYHRYRLKRRTTAGWAANNEVLLAGEPGIEVLVDGTEKIKHGDGVKTWAQLSYAAGGGASLSNATPQALGTAAAGTSAEGSRADHRHQMPNAAQVGADASGTAAAAVAAHAAAANPHPGYALESDSRFSDARTPTAHKATHATGGSDALTPGDVGAEPAGASAAALAAHLAAANPHSQYELKNALGDAAYKDTGTTAGTLAAGDDARFASLAPLNSPTFTGTVSGITKAMVGLGNVDNISDANKPVSAATATALAGKADLNHNQAWGTITGTPTTLSGYAITDAISSTTTRSANIFLAGPASGAAAAPTFRAIVSADLPNIGTNFEQTITAVGSTYTLDASVSNEFVAAASIAANTTISLTNLSAVAANRNARFVFLFTWASGAITLSAPAGYTFKRSGSVPGSAGEYQLVITARGNGTVLYVGYGSAYT